VSSDNVGISEFRPPRYVLARAVRTRSGGDPNRREDCEHGWYATYCTDAVIGPDLHLVGPIQWGHGAHTRAKRDACRLHRRWARQLKAGGPWCCFPNGGES
jgi:hypothetical protein